MSEYTEYYVVPAPSVESVWNRLKEHRIRSAIYIDDDETAKWNALPEHRRFAAVYTLDASLQRLGELFHRALWLWVDENPGCWRIDVYVHGQVVRLLFAEPPLGEFSEEGDDALFAASRSPHDSQLRALEEFFAVPRELFTPYLRMGGLKKFVKATAMPLHIPTNQQCLEWGLQEGWLDEKIVISYNDYD